MSIQLGEKCSKVLKKDLTNAAQINLHLYYKCV